MGRKILLAGLIIISVCGVSALAASASTTVTKIKSFSPTAGAVGTEVTLKGKNLAGATEVTFNGIIATVISDTAKEIEADVPLGATTGFITVDTPAGSAESASEFTVITPIDDSVSIVSDGEGYCALLTSGGVDCWGYGHHGELGNGTFENSDTPVAVDGVGGTGTLTGVTGLVGGHFEEDGNYCALLSSGGVDCWGYGYDGNLGNGMFYTSSPYGSDTPVAVEGVGGTGTLTGVTSLVSGWSEGTASYCALLTSSGVDCWGFGENGQLGNGSLDSSADPVAVEGVGGTGTLTGVAYVVHGFYGFCALLTSSGLECWGDGNDGELGNGAFNSSDTPVAVEGVGGTGTLAGVASVFGGTNPNATGSYCAMFTSGAVDCWGDGYYGELGNGSFNSSDTPVAVEGVGGTGTLTGVTSVVSYYNATGGYCALLASSGVDCWGYGQYGDLGNGTFYSSSPYGSATPVAVEGVGGTGTLTRVSSLIADGNGFCAVLTSSGVDCWGYGQYGDLGNGTFYSSSPYGSATPVAVEGVGGTGTLTGVSSLVGGTVAIQLGGYCATLTSGGVDCWGYGKHGNLGNDTFYASSPYGSATPVEVGMNAEG